jgi:riboflavin biosynthesis pyrimidine reductase
VKWLRPAENLPDLLGVYAQVPRAAREGRPHVLANMVGGLDGTAAISGRVGGLSNPADAQLFVDLRSLADVVLVGAETARRERYGPVRLSDQLREARQARGLPAVPPIAVVTRSLMLDWSIGLFSDPDPTSPPLIVTCSKADSARLADAREHAEVLVAGAATVDLAAALRALRHRGASVVLCEGGPRLLGELVAVGLLDELCLCLAPVMGGDPLPLSVTPAGAGLAHLRLAHALADDSTLFLRYERTELG